ncbi:cytochrome P450 [Streptomyces katrae]|uniref:Cytochrome P450 n=1 Tax=Streptomyces katrae TaxID=68223 RepID=A0ABT7H136_9ACTN|nr:cytochrome P450 [Streptomyces katrae]MDK9499598.1 cytochrome P450 [Streptomyces katrae]
MTASRKTPGTSPTQHPDASASAARPRRPGPPALPFIGHAWPLMRSPLRFVSALASYGDVVPVRLGPLPVQAVTHPDLVHQVLVTQARHFVRGRLFEKAGQIGGEQGLVVTSGTTHLEDRRALQPHFRREHITGFAEGIRQATEEVTAHWKPGQTVHVDRTATEIALSSLVRSLLGDRPSKELAGVFHQHLPTLSQGLMTRAVLPEWCARLPLPANRTFQRAIGTTRAAVEDAITACRRPGTDETGLLGMLTAQRDDNGRPWTDTKIRDHVLHLALAGVETTGATLAWTFHELGRNPDIADRLRDEVDHTLDGAPATPENITALPYTGRVITETLRRYAMWLAMRRTTVPVTLGEHALPAGTEVVYSAYALHHDPRWFPHPYRFDPDRWLPETARALPKGAYIPFGSGVHKCIGDSLALMEITIALATVCRHWHLTPLPGRPVREVARADVHPDHLPMTATPRRPRRKEEP